MSETILRELLTELADLVEPVDLAQDVRRGVRRHQRILTSAAVTGVGAVTGAIVFFLTTMTGTSPDSISSAGPAGVSPSPATDHGATATTSVHPSYLPPGTRLADEKPIRNPNDGRTLGKAAEYQLPGEANADTMPPGPLTSAEALDGHFHPGTSIEVTFIAHFTGPGPVPCFRPDCVVSTTQVDGHRATIAANRNGYGVVRIDWLDSAGYHVVMCDRNKTSDGTSGIKADQLLRVAASLYPR